MTAYAMSADLPIKTPVSLEKVVFRIFLVIIGLSVAYLLSVFILGFAWLPLTGVDADSSELTLSLVQCLLGVAAHHVPKVVTKLTRVKFPDFLCAFFYVFVICGTVLGELFSLFYAVPMWDSLLHAGSGVMTGILGSILIVTLLERKECGHLISPLVVAIASICFAICIGAFWEIYEFSVDSLLSLNMQKFMTYDGLELAGQAALSDTMKDLIVDAAGAGAAAIASFASLKREAGWLHAYRADEVKTARRAFNKRQAFPKSAA